MMTMCVGDVDDDLDDDFDGEVFNGDSGHVMVMMVAMYGEVRMITYSLLRVPVPRTPG